MTATEQRVLEALRGHCFNGPECSPSRELLAAETLLSERHLGRVLCALRNQGHLSWTHERQRGCRWWHNRYRLAVWSPPKRTRTLEDITRGRAEIRARQARRFRGDSTPCPTEGTTSTGERTTTTVNSDNPALESSTNSETQLQNIASARIRETNHETDLVGEGIASEPRLDAQQGVANGSHAVPAAPSPTENPAERIALLEKLYTEAEERAADLATTVAGLEHNLRRSCQAETALRNEIANLRETEPESEDVAELLALWREEVKAGDKKVKIAATGGPRSKHVKWALKKYGKERCTHAILGCTLDPRAMTTVTSGRWAGHTFNDIAKDILKDEQTIERFEGLWLDRGQKSDYSRPAVSDPLAELLSRLDAVKQEREGQWQARCPAHEDRHASLSVAAGQKGLLVHCHVGCTPEQIAAAVGLPIVDWFTADKAPALVAPARKPEPLPTYEQIAQWANRLHSHQTALERLKAVKGWTPDTLLQLGVGLHDKRIIFPVSDHLGKLATIVKYQPGGTPKSKALSGRARNLFPAPELFPDRVLWLVEGEPDGVSLIELGLAGSGVPGVNGWRKEFAGRYTGRRVVVCMDCDPEGRTCAAKVAAALAPVALDVRVVDLDPGRADKFDLSDFLLAGGTREQLIQRAKDAPQFGMKEAA